MKTLPALSALVGALCVVPAAAAAQTRHPPVVRAVAHHDLDLSTARGRKMLDRRIDIAIAAACGDASSADPMGWKAIRRCRADAADRVSEQRDGVIAAARRSGRARLAAQ